MFTGTAERALSLLGSGVPQEAAASALGVTPSYISQLLANEDFAAAVTEKRFEILTKHNDRDAGYDEIEDKLIDKLKKSLPLLLRPADILGAIRVINGANRRGQDSQDSLITNQNIVQLTMPVQIVQQFTTNIHNQVVKTGEQDLLTIHSGDLLKQTESKLELEAEARQEAIEYIEPIEATIDNDNLITDTNEVLAAL